MTGPVQHALFRCAPLVEMRYRVRTDHRYITTVIFTLCPKNAPPPIFHHHHCHWFAQVNRTYHGKTVNVMSTTWVGQQGSIRSTHSCPEVNVDEKWRHLRLEWLREQLMRFECLSWFATCLRHFETGKLQICSFNETRKCFFSNIFSTVAIFYISPSVIILRQWTAKMCKQKNGVCSTVGSVHHRCSAEIQSIS